jgi:anti-sigma B factor antagonist
MPLAIKGVNYMNFEMEKIGTVVIILMPGESFEAAVVKDFNRKMAPVIDENNRVLFDLSNIRFLDSMGCGALLSCHKKLKEKGGKMGLCCAQKQVNAIFDLMGFPQLFDVFKTREEALKAYG